MMEIEEYLFKYSTMTFIIGIMLDFTLSYAYFLKDPEFFYTHEIDRRFAEFLKNGDMAWALIEIPAHTFYWFTAYVLFKIGVKKDKRMLIFASLFMLNSWAIVHAKGGLSWWLNT